MTQIYYICETPEKKFHFFEKYNDCKAKEEELGIKYGKKKFMDVEVNPYPIQFKILKSYHGIVWLCVKWEDMDHVAYSIHSHWKTAKGNKEYGYDIKKIVLTPYEDWNNRFKNNDFDDYDLGPNVPPTGLF